MKLSLTTRVLIGLLLGLVGGVAVSLSSGDMLPSVVPLVEPIGTLWINAIRMTVVPLIVSLLITAIAGDHKSGMVASLGRRMIAVFAVLIAGVCIFSALIASPLMALLEFDPATISALKASTGSTASASAAEVPSFRDWMVGLIPSNPLKAAVDGEMLSLVVFIALFAMALSRSSSENRASILSFFLAVRDAMFTLIGWIMAVAPYGVFAVVFPVAVKLGTRAASAFGYYVLVVCSLTAVAMGVLYVIAVVYGRLSLSSFARACAPAQVIAFSTRSSLASLPAMSAAAESLGFSQKVSGLVLPVAVSIFKFASPIGRSCGAYFIARLYGVDLGVAETAAIAGAVGLLSFYTPGIPSGGLLVMTPLFAALNLPIEGIGLLIALDPIIDMFMTPVNVTANVTVAAILTRDERALGTD
jgi:Na+/H+-dicarboxylate symporter